jgi:hypothetical protein
MSQPLYSSIYSCILTCLPHPRTPRSCFCLLRCMRRSVHAAMQRTRTSCVGPCSGCRSATTAAGPFKMHGRAIICANQHRNAVTPATGSSFSLGNCSNPMLTLRLPKQKFSPSRPPAVCRRGGRQLMRGAARLAHLNTWHTFIHILPRFLLGGLCSPTTATFIFPLPAHQAAQRTLRGQLTRRPFTEVCPRLLHILQIARYTRTPTRFIQRNHEDTQHIH